MSASDTLMDLDAILAPADVVIGLRAGTKPALLGALARRAAGSLGFGGDGILGGDTILAALLSREDLGSTGVGGGIALPHARLEAVARPYGLLARLRDPVAFAAIDDRPVDLVFLLLLPAGRPTESLNALAGVARRLRDPAVAAALRAAPDAARLYALIRRDPGPA